MRRWSARHARRARHDRGRAGRPEWPRRWPRRGRSSGLTSPSHPDAASWYADPSPSFSWNCLARRRGLRLPHRPEHRGRLSPPAIASPAVRFSRAHLTAGTAARGRSRAATSTATARPTSSWPTTPPARSASCWATATAPSRPRSTYPVGADPTASRSPTSTATARPTWPSPTGAPAPSACCWATATAPCSRRSPTPSAPTPSQIAVGDFNGDGKLDLAVATYCLSAVQRAAGQRRRHLPGGDKLRRRRPTPRPWPTATSTATAYPTWPWPTGRANSVSILLGNGDGTFQAHVDYPVGGHPHSVVAGDFNGDGTARSGRGELARRHRQRAARARATARSATAATYTVGTSSAQLVVGDFNGDGIPDLAVVNRLSGQPSGVLLGKGDGTFMACQSVRVADEVPTRDRGRRLQRRRHPRSGRALQRDRRHDGRPVPATRR